MKPLPEVVQIKGVDFDVKLVDDDEIKKVSDAPDDIYACCDYDSTSIFIVDYIPLDSAWCAFFHECIHAIASGYESLDLLEENAVETVACNFYQIIKELGLL